MRDEILWVRPAGTYAASSPRRSSEFVDGQSLGGGLPDRAGFTLMEMVLVLVLAGTLLSIVVPLLMRHTVDAKIAKTKAGLEKLRTAFELYKANTGNGVPLGSEADALLNGTPPVLEQIPADGFEGGSDFHYMMGDPPCDAVYGGWCYSDGAQKILPNLPSFDPDYGNQDFINY